MAKIERRAARLLIASRFIRSIGQGALVVDFSLYLKALGWSPVQISGILSAALILGVALTVVVGPLSDRWGRRRLSWRTRLRNCSPALRPSSRQVRRC